MTRIALSAVLVTLSGGVLAAPPAGAARPPDTAEFLFRAVADGLAADGVPPALARALAGRNDDFVKKCGICGMTRKALFAHGELKDAPAARDGKGLPADLAKRLDSVKDEIRRAALRELVQRYLERSYAGLASTPDVKAAIQRDLEQMRKDAMPMLGQDMKYCPSCDGATCRTPKL